MIWFDTTKSAQAAHRSGLTRVTARLQEELGNAAIPVRWPDWNRAAQPQDWFFTAELFRESERPGFWEFLRRPPCRLAAVFHDAIPLKRPDITWPQSVSRHPEYMKMLASFDRVFAVSEASRIELEGFWRWQGLEPRARVTVMALGADGSGTPRRTTGVGAGGRPSLLCVGIVEPRKNQAFLAEVCAALWTQGLDFDLHLVGRVNPHFGKPLMTRIRRVARIHPGLQVHGPVGDAEVARLYAGASALAFPTIAEGCGLPLLESLWHGVPCVCSDLPVLRENSEAGGCLALPVNDSVAWQGGLRAILEDRALLARLAEEACRRPLPTWASAADFLRSALAE